MPAGRSWGARLAEWRGVRAGAPGPWGYLIAVAAVGAAFALKVLFGEWVTPTYTPFYLPILLAVVVGGAGPGLAAVALSTALVWFWIIKPVGSFQGVSATDVIGLALFAAVGSLMTALVEAGRTARLRAQRSEDRLRSAIEGSRDGFVDVDVSSGAVFRSPRYWEVAGWPAGSSPPEQSSLLELIHPEDAARVKRAWATLLDGSADHFDEEYRLLTRAGSWSWVRSRLQGAGRDLSGRPARVAGTISDVNDRVLAHETLRESERRFRAMADGAPVLIWRSGTDRGCTWFNQPWLEFTGRGLDQEQGSGWTTGVHPDDLRRCLDTYASHFDRRQPFTMEFRLRRHDGQYRWLVDAGRPLLDETGAFTGFIGSCVDVSALRSLEQQVAISSRLAAMGTLVAGIAHEINNPLSVVMGNHALAVESIGTLADGLRRGQPMEPEPALRVLDEVEEELRESMAGGQRINRIVKDLTTIGKPNAVRTRRRVAEVVEDALRWLPASVRTGAVFELEDRGAPDLLAAAGQVEQVLVNLIVNAVMASPEGRPAPVRIRFGPGGAETARLEVIDQGCGIDPANQGRIFEPFFTTREVGKGMGLGLSVCHAIVTAYGGTIAVESALGKGSTFRVELPAAPGLA